MKSHRQFILDQDLPYALASDQGGALISRWGLLVNKTMYGKPVTGVERTTVVVDRGGVVREVFSKVTVAGHVEEVLKVVRSLQ